MILIDKDNDNNSGHFHLIAYNREEVVVDIRTFLIGVMDNPEILEIFLEEFNNRIPEMEERIKDVQNSISNSDRE